MAGAAFTPRWTGDGSTPKLCGGCSPAFRSPEAKQTPVYAVDASVWPRCDDAQFSPERGFYYHPSRHSAGQPMVAGWAYQFIAQLNYRARESWTAPVDLRRVRPARDANARWPPSR